MPTFGNSNLPSPGDPLPGILSHPPSQRPVAEGCAWSSDLALPLAQMAGGKSSDSGFPPATGIGSMKRKDIFAQPSVRPVHLVVLPPAEGSLPEAGRTQTMERREAQRKVCLGDITKPLDYLMCLYPMF